MGKASTQNHRKISNETWRKFLNAIRVSLRWTKRTNRKPDNTDFKQQSLPAWKPYLTVENIVPFIFLIGASFVPIGIGMIFISNNVMEKVIPYTDCKNDRNQMCKDVISNVEARRRDCRCNISFEIEENWIGKVIMYYGLDHFYQSHRRYVASRDDDQLLGNLEIHKNSLFTEHKCNPYFTCETEEECCNEFGEDGNCTRPLPIGTIFLPCGAIASSMFSDDISLW